MNIPSIYFASYAIKRSDNDVFSVSRLYLNLISTTEKVQRFRRLYVDIPTAKSFNFNGEYEFLAKHKRTKLNGYFLRRALSLRTHLARLYLTAFKCSRPMSVAKRTTSCLAILSLSQVSSISLSARSLNLIPIGLINFPLFSKYLIVQKYHKAQLVNKFKKVAESATNYT